MAQFIDTNFGRTDIFEIVEDFPAGYIVWNIGRQNFPHPGFVPVARPDRSHAYHIILGDLKAVKCADEGEALYIMKCAHIGKYGARGMGRFDLASRVSEYRSIKTTPVLTAEQIATMEPIQAPGLYFIWNGQRIEPSVVYFSSDLRLYHNNPEEYDGRLYAHYDNALRPVYGPDRKQFERRGIASVCAKYRDGVICDFFKE